jgi:hypothetical protein
LAATSFVEAVIRPEADLDPFTVRLLGYRAVKVGRWSECGYRNQWVSGV